MVARDEETNQKNSKALAIMSNKHQQLVNFLSGNVAIMVSLIVQILLIPIMIRQLGLGGYGIVAFVISIGLLVRTLGNALSGATARYLTISHTRGEDRNASLYMSNTLAIVASGGSIIALLIYIYVKFFSKTGNIMPMGFIEVMLLSIVLSAISGVFSTGTFVREKFVIRNAIDSFCRISYGVICGLLLLYSNIGIWSVAIATLTAAVLRLLFFHRSCNKLLPDAKGSLKLVQVRHIFEVSAFVGWMLLSFCGGYVISSGMIAVVENCVSTDNLGRFALATNVGLLIRQGLGCLSAVTSPATYRRIALGDYRGATYQLQKFLFLAMCIGATAMVILILEGTNILHVWLGASTPVNMKPLLVVIGISAILSTSNIPISVFLAGVGKVRNYGVATLVGACAAVTVGFAILRSYPSRLVWIAALPAIVVVLKNCIVVFLHRDSFNFSPIRKMLGKIMGVFVLFIISIFVGLAAKTWLAGDTIFYVGMRVGLIGSPLVLLLAFLLKPRHKKTIESESG